MTIVQTKRALNIQCNTWNKMESFSSLLNIQTSWMIPIVKRVLAKACIEKFNRRKRMVLEITGGSSVDESCEPGTSKEKSLSLALLDSGNLIKRKVTTVCTSYFKGCLIVSDNTQLNANINVASAGENYLCCTNSSQNVASSVFSSGYRGLPSQRKGSTSQQSNVRTFH